MSENSDPESNASTAPLGAVPEPGRRASPPFAEACALAGFMTEDTVRNAIPSFDALPQATQEALRERFAVSVDSANSVSTAAPRFYRVEEREVLDFLASVAPVAPASLENLLGFEWVEIRNILAGHLLTRALQTALRLPPPQSPLQLARYCLLSFSENLDLETSARAMMADTDFNLSHAGFQLQGSRVAVVYNIQPVFAPIHLLIVHSQVIAIRGLDKLVHLNEAGVDRALCLISYGFGESALPFLPSTAEEVLKSARPPLVTDFVDSSLAVRIPVPLPKSVAQFKADVLRLHQT